MRRFRAIPSRVATSPTAPATDDFGCGSQSQHVRPWLHRNQQKGVEMAKLIYAAITSLDGYVAEPGRSDSAVPDEAETRDRVNRC
jgi:hypothetical protein